MPENVLRENLQTMPPDAAFKYVYKSETNGRVDLHILHGKKETPKNIKTGSFLADQGFNIKLLPILGKNDDKICS